MAQKIKKQSGYPTSDGQMFDKYQDAVKYQSKLDLDKAVDECEGTTTTADFIKEHAEVVSEYIKYHCKPAKPKTAAKKPAKKPEAGAKKESSAA